VLCLVRETGARLGLRLTCPLMPGDIGGAGGSGGLGRVGDRIAPPQCGRQRGASHSLSLSALLSGSISRHAYQFFTTLILLAPATTLRPSVPTIARVSPSLLPCQDVCNGISVLVINAAVYSILIDRSFVFRSARVPCDSMIHDCVVCSYYVLCITLTSRPGCIMYIVLCITLTSRPGCIFLKVAGRLRVDEPRHARQELVGARHLLGTL
jgi:hypothetical protein